MNLLVLGANSDVAYAAAKKMAQAESADVCLASRDMVLLEKKARDIEIRFGVKAEALPFDATDYESHKAFYSSLDPKPDGVILAFGYLGDQMTAQADFEEARRIIDTNYVGAVSILEIIASDFQKRGHGFIVGISSVAGERGRQSNYMYGAAKGALTVYLSGLRNRLSRSGVKVVTVLPGFVRTKMTENMDLPEALMGEPGEIAEDIFRAIKRNKAVIYTRWYWRWIMLVIKAIPEKIFMRLNL
jgi:decaprenylphospho-beta-D-erythro-pentofuranosid-2-ulose 2-reductase